MIADTKQDKFIQLKNTWLYCFNERQVEITQQEETKKVYEYDTVEVLQIDYESLVNAVLKLYWSTDKEFALRNNYERYKIGLVSDEKYKTEYLDYLNKVAELKTTIKQDLL